MNYPKPGVGVGVGRGALRDPLALILIRFSLIAQCLWTSDCPIAQLAPEGKLSSVWVTHSFQDQICCVILAPGYRGKLSQERKISYLPPAGKGFWGRN